MLDQVISHYRITQKLGAGGMGVVYKAEDLTLGRTVALKFLPTEVAVSDNDKESLLWEARAACALDHPNIGVIHGLEESADHQLFIVMGYYEGETLSEKLNRGVISVRDSLDFAIQVAKGLSAAHSRNIVHRDIKPSNIIITKDNVAKIVDFGLARVVATASATQSVSNTGTLPYMAPEQILGEAVDQRADVWALGVVIVQMLTGSHPFLRPNTAAMSFAILNQAPAAVDAVPRPIQPIVYRALSKQASHRYATAEEMARDLDTARVQITATPMPLDEPTVTRSLSPKDLKRYVENASTPRWSPVQSRRRRLLLAGLAAALAAGVAFSFPRVRASLFESAYAGTERHIAVLPFENKSNDSDSELISSGLMDSVTNRLSNLDAAQQSLWVVPASVVRSRHISDPQSAYRTLGATIVVEGGLQRRGKNLVLTLNLVDAKRLRQMGSEEIEEDTGDLAAIEDDAIVRLARLLKVRVPESGLAQPGSVSRSAYESYLKALGYLQRYDKPGNLDRAIDALNSATQSDPRFALSYATLGEAYRLKFQMDNHPPYLSDAAKNAQEAVELNDHLPAPHATLGEINITLGKTDLALQEFQKALDLAPRDADAAVGLAITYEYMGRSAESEATYKRAIALRPDYWDGYTALGNFYFRQNRFQDAIAQYKRVIELTPDNPEGYSNLGAGYMALSTPASNTLAESAFRKSIQLGPTYVPYTNLGILYLNERRYAEAAQEARKALDYNDKDWESWDTLLLAYTWLNDEENIRTTRATTLRLLEDYVAANPKASAAQSRLSTFYAENKQREKGLVLAGTALALSPKNSTVLADLAATYELLGDRKKALQYAQESLRNGATLADLERRPSLRNLLASPSFRSNGMQ
jgi:eukaryotic-like serine/threonine-protein kinase